jgi:hypothetical protein
MTNVNTVTRYVETALVATISLVALVGIVRFVVLSF